MHFLASGVEYAHLATQLMGDAKSSCHQLQTIALMAWTTVMPIRIWLAWPTWMHSLSNTLQRWIAAAAQRYWRLCTPMLGART